MSISKIARAESQRGLLLVMFAAVLWGTVGVTTKSLYTASDANPLSVGFFRLAFSVPVLFIACWLALGRQMLRVERRDLGLMILIGAMTAQYQACYFGAIERVGVAVAALVTLCTAPVMVALVSSALTKDRLTGRIGLALVCALAGTALLINFQPAETLRSDVIGGVLLALGSAVSYAVVAMCSRALAGRYHPLQPIAIGFAVGAILLLMLAVIAPAGLVIRYPVQGWLRLIYLGLVPTAFAYFVFLIGMRTTTAIVATIATLVEPLTSTTLAWLLFDERLGPTGWLGALLLLSAMGMLYWNGQRR